MSLFFFSFCTRSVTPPRSDRRRSSASVRSLAHMCPDASAPSGVGASSVRSLLPSSSRRSSSSSSCSQPLVSTPLGVRFLPFVPGCALVGALVANGSVLSFNGRKLCNIPDLTSACVCVPSSGNPPNKPVFLDRVLREAHCVFHHTFTLPPAAVLGFFW